MFSHPYISFFHLLVNVFSVIIIIIIFFRWVFSECTEAIATSLIQQDTNFPVIVAFTIDFGCTMWIKMRSLAGSYKEAKGSANEARKLVTQKTITST